MPKIEKMLRITNRKDNSHSSQNARAQEASRYEARKPRRQEVTKPRIQGAKKSCCRSLFLSFLLSFVASFFLFPSFLVFMYFLCPLCFLSLFILVFFLYFFFSFFLSFFLSFFFSFFLSFFPPPAWGSNILVFLIPAREARNVVFYYKIKDFVCFLILICFLVDPYLLFLILFFV